MRFDLTVSCVYVMFEILLHIVAVYVDEDDIGTYTIKAVDDPRTLNKTLYLRPPENILTQRQLIAKWEKLSGRQLDKISIPAEDLLASMEGKKITNLFHDQTRQTFNTIQNDF